MIDLLKTIPGLETPDLLKPLFNNQTSQNIQANQGSGLLGLGGYQPPAQGQNLINTLQGQNQGANQLAPVAPLNQQTQVQPEPKPEPIRIPNASSFSGPPGWLDSLVRSTATGPNGMDYWWNQNQKDYQNSKQDLNKRWYQNYGSDSRAGKWLSDLRTSSGQALNDQKAQHDKWWGDAQNAYGQYQSAIDQMAGAPALYDQWVDQAGKAYLNRQDPFEDTLRNPLNRMSASGAFDSSLTRDVTTDLARQRAKGFQEHQEQLNTQALELKAQNLAQMADARGNAAQLGGLMADQALSGRNDIWNQLLQSRQNEAQLAANLADQAWASRLGYYNSLNQNDLNSLNWLGNLGNLARYNTSNTPQLNILPYL
ncbi:hypothetical protein [Dethiosulfatarculus sandiegensis]|uniref:Uncharacterized protein n=1 Tax=Dethiosulfatarculus sandiegensis TaxID=1429043 RepID=A0A0D2J760_9BACT|nr:hypothetical protein [Dethiosulfatarculus sandiegensis]KIX14004.1 hypothetical protein X474_13060 [Dethiosulfatarculus sandiegensis]